VTFQKKKVLVVAKTYPNLSRKYERVVCTAGLDLTTMSWIRIFPIRFFDLKYANQYKKYDIIEIEVEPTNDKYTRKESHKAKDETIKRLQNIGTENNWLKRKEILLPLLKNSIEELEVLYKMDHTSMGIIKPKNILDFRIEPIDRCRDWERDLVMGVQQTLDGIPYESAIEKIPYKFSYVFECNDPNCNTKHDLMIEDWEIGALYREMKRKYGEKVGLEKIKQKYKEEFSTEKKDLYFILGTESAWNNWLIISVFYPRREP